MNVSRILIAAVGAVTMSSPTLSAPIVIGAPADPNTGNCIPFGCSLATDYQQVYAASNFSGSVTLNSISFYNTSFSTGGTANGGVFQLALSTTAVAVNALSTTLAANLGADNTVVFTGGIYTPGFGNALTLTFSTPFSYDPANGNLLLDVKWDGTNSGTGVFFDTRNGSAIFSRAFGGGNSGTTSNYGLVTGFNTAVPEPANWALMIVGFGLIGATVRRHRGVAAA